MTTAIAAPVTAALTALYAELAAEIPDVLTAEFSLAAVWVDLCRIAGEPVPRDGTATARQGGASCWRRDAWQMAPSLFSAARRLWFAPLRPHRGPLSSSYRAIHRQPRSPCLTVTR